MRLYLLLPVLLSLGLGGCMHSSESSILSGDIVSQDLVVSGSMLSGEVSFYASVPSCVSYISTVTCMNKQGNDARQEQGNAMVTKVLETRKLLNQDQLKATCDASKNVLIENKALIEKAGCSL